MRPQVLAFVLLIFPASAAADPIEGNWRTADLSIARIFGCADSFCIALETGEFAGKEIGKLKLAGEGKYTGKVVDPTDDREYTGQATLKGNELKLSGCALKIFCQTQVWSRILD